MSEEGITPWTVTVVVGHRVGAETKLLEEWPVLLTAETALQFSDIPFFTCAFLRFFLGKIILYQVLLYCFGMW